MCIDMSEQANINRVWDIIEKVGVASVIWRASQICLRFWVISKWMTVPMLLPTQFVQGLAARTTAGLSYAAAGAARVSVGGELGGLGSQNFTTWSVRGRASVPF
jgi:hypothetical protein